MTFFIIAVSINYTFTIVRIDSVGLFGRTTATMMVALTFGLLVFLYKYGDEILPKALKLVLISFCIAVVILLQDRPPTGPDIRNLVTPLSLGDEIKNIKTSYKLNDVVYIDGEKEGIPELGKGFISNEKIEYLKIYKEMKEKLVKKDEYFWPLWNRELIKIFDSKISTKIDSPYLTKSLKSTKENLISMNEKPIFITDLLNYQSYYTFRWIIDNGYIMYRYKGVDFWIRPDRYQEVFGNIEEAKKNMMEIYPSQEIAKIPYSLGNSMKSLSKRFIKEEKLNLDKINIEYNQINEISKNKFEIINSEDPFFTINLSENINGGNFDFIYIELLSNKSDKDLKNNDDNRNNEEQESGLRKDVDLKNNKKNLKNEESDINKKNVVNQEDKKIGLVLSGGTAKGLAHIGILKVLDEEKVPIEYVTGTSMGSIIGGMYSVGYTPEEIEEIAVSMDWMSLFSDKIERKDKGAVRNSIEDKNSTVIPIKNFMPKLPSGVVGGKTASQRLNELFYGALRILGSFQENLRQLRLIWNLGKV